jgi:eukaryotic-like serine/threonine-protein kinase
VAGLREQLQDALADRYQLDRELGRGGMATVFLAHDPRHDRPVALKVLHPELAATLGPERFQREIKTAARLQHPHILTLLDSGEAAGQLWFTMPYVEGESLRDRLRREVQLPVNAAIQIARELALALDYAHRHGVVHRDIKPENILLSDGQALIADFGVAKALGEAGEQLTATGLAIGTPAYMSPEQASGDRRVDARSDIYSLGCVLYEMLAGEPPYTGPSPQAVIAKHFAGLVPSLRVVRPDVSLELEVAICKALVQVPADRFPTAAEFARALAAPVVPTPVSTSASTPARLPHLVVTPRLPTHRRLRVAAVALGLGFLVGLGVLFAWHRSDPGAAADVARERVLAVLPFENQGAVQDEYFADGVADALRGKLAAIPGVQVIARESSAPYKKTSKPPERIARELGAKYLLTGIVRWERGAGGAGRVLVSPELVEVTPGHTPRAKWQQPFHAPLTDMFQVQAEIAGRVAQALDLTLADTVRQQLAERPTQDLAAYDSYLKGEEISHGPGGNDPPTLQRTAAYYLQATALDSTFALAWAQLARVHARIYGGGLGEPSPAKAEAVRREAERAVALAPNRAEGHLALAEYYTIIARDFARALDEYGQAQRAAPTNADVLSGAAGVETRLGRWDEGLAHLQQAQMLDPRSAHAARRLATALVALRRYPAALAATEHGLALAPTNLQLLENKAIVSLGQGDLAGARAVLAAPPNGVDPAALVAYFATYGDLFWVLDDAQQELLLGLTPAHFGDERGAWGLALAQTYGLRGDQARSKTYADSARLALEGEVQAMPEDGQGQVLLGLALAYLGRKAEAIQRGERGVVLVPIAKDAHLGPYVQHQLVRIYILVGEYERALDRLEPLLKVPYSLSPAWLRIDPNFDPLRGNPRFERLVKGR